MQLTKSDFLKHKECESFAWFIKNKPEVLTHQKIDPFAQSLIDQGAEVEEWAYKLFQDGIHVRAYHEKAVDTTKRLIKEGKRTIFQATFTDGELYAMIDILQWNEMYQAWDIIEVKSSSDSDWKKKGKIATEHLDDTGFQRILLQNLGLRVANVYLLLLNSEYVKEGPIHINALFSKIEVTDQLIHLEEGHKAEITKALQTINSPVEPSSCSCVYKARNKHCGAFSYLYPDTPEYAVYDLNRIGNSKKLLAEMIDKSILGIDDIKDASKLKNMKLWQWQTYVKDQEIILHERIKSDLESLEYPLYFLDYETLPSAIPKYDGTSPHQQVIFQYSLHIIEQEGEAPKHKEYIHRSQDAPMQAIADNLRNDIGDIGSIIVWYKGFEVSRTKELAEAILEHRDFLLSLVDRIYDLMDIVAKGYYIHKDFRGSASIKSVLPVMCPDLSYKSLNVQNGEQAMNTYRDLIFSDKYNGNEEDVVKDLLAYCELDTWAMVRIWQEMKEKVE